MRIILWCRSILQQGGIVMELKQAMELIKKVCSAFMGNKNDHIAIDQAIRVVEERIEKSEEKTEKKKWLNSNTTARNVTMARLTGVQNNTHHALSVV